jgi:OOP family OmpA-OmpF porin
MALRTRIPGLALRLIAVALAAAPAAAWSGDYVGVLKAPKSSFTPGGFFSTLDNAGTAYNAPGSGENGYRLKLGYKYSRYLSVQGEYVDFGRTPSDIFSATGSLSSTFRSTGYGVDTVATVPLWRSFSFYGRLGAYRGEARNAFAAYSTSLLGDTRSTRLRYGLGMRYDFTKAFGIKAELERYSPLGASTGSESDAADLVSVGVSWRF